MGDELEVTVLLPCLNEAETVDACVRKALGALQRIGVTGEVVLSDNGSTDGSQALAQAAGARVVNAPIRGYGAALQHGIHEARGRYIIMADADDSYDLSNLEPFIERLRAGHDVVMGNRFRGGVAPGAMPALHRYLGNPVLSRLGRVLFNLKSVGDLHCGIRGFRRDRVLDLDLRMPGMEFASEMVVRAALAGYDIVEVPTTLRPDGRSRAPHLRTWSDGWRHLRFLLVFAPDKTVIWPGLALVVLGLAGAAALVPGPVTIGSVTFDINALVYACLSVLVGSQLVMFGGIAKIYGRLEGITTDADHSLWRTVLKLDITMSLGLVLVLGGIAGTAGAVTQWGSAGFGDLDPQGTIRVVLPSATAVALGLLVAVAGMVASLMTLPARANHAPPSQPPELADGDAWSRSEAAPPTGVHRSRIARSPRP
jgi:Glycosyl transferase family 2